MHFCANTIFMSLFFIINIFSAKNLWQEKEDWVMQDKKSLREHRGDPDGHQFYEDRVWCERQAFYLARIMVTEGSSWRWSSGSVATSLICFLSLFFFIQISTLFLPFPNFSFQLGMAFALPFGKLLQNSLSPSPRSPMFLCLSYVCPHVTDKKPRHPELPERKGLPSCQGYDQQATSSCYWYWEGRGIKASPF